MISELQNYCIMNQFSAVSCVYTKDVMRVTRRSAPFARRLIIKIREKLGKEKHQYITAKELADYLGLRIEEVLTFL